MIVVFSPSFPLKMFATAVRRFTGTAFRLAKTAAEMEAPHTHGVEISKAQRIANNGFIDGMTRVNLAATMVELD